MKMAKVQPLFKPELGKFTKFIKILSKLYLLPVEINTERSTVRYSFFSIRTLVNILAISIQFIMFLIWILTHREETLLVYKAYLEVYEISDLFVMLFFPGFLIVSFGMIPFLHATGTVLSSVPDIVLDNELNLPQNFNRLMFIRFSEFIGLLLISLGNYFALEPITPLSKLDDFINVSLVFLVPATITTIMLHIMTVTNFAVLDNLETRLKNVPVTNMEVWIKSHTDLFERYQVAANSLIFGFIAFR